MRVRGKKIEKDDRKMMDNFESESELLAECTDLKVLPVGW